MKLDPVHISIFFVILQLVHYMAKYGQNVASVSNSITIAANLSQFAAIGREVGCNRAGLGLLSPKLA
jgi:hypothetical protein